MTQFTFANQQLDTSQVGTLQKLVKTYDNNQKRYVIMIGVMLRNQEGKVYAMDEWEETFDTQIEQALRFRELEQIIQTQVMEKTPNMQLMYPTDSDDEEMEAA